MTREGSKESSSTFSVPPGLYPASLDSATRGSRAARKARARRPEQRGNGSGSCWEAEVWSSSRRGRRVRQAVRLRWSVTRPVSASPGGCGGVGQRPVTVCSGAGAGGQFPVQVLVGSPYSSGDACGGCVCVFKGLGEITPLRSKLEFQLEFAETRVRIVMASLLVLKSNLGSALSGCEALAGLFPPLPQFSHQENGV